MSDHYVCESPNLHDVHRRHRMAPDDGMMVTHSRRDSFERTGRTNQPSHRQCRRSGGRTLLLALISAWATMAGPGAMVESFAPPVAIPTGVRPHRDATSETSMERTWFLSQNHDRWQVHQAFEAGRLSASSILTEPDTTDEIRRSARRRSTGIGNSPASEHRHWAHVLPLAVPLTSHHWRKRTKLHKHKQWQQHDAYLSSVLPNEAHPPTLAWAQRHTSVHRLRAAFGGNRNKLWGDLDAATTRRLYKTLLPTALLGLVQAGVHEPEHLAPLAYQARVAAKLYARERSTVPVRILANLYDGWRQFTSTGRFRCHGMTYEQIWDKYRRAVLEVDSSKGSDINTGFGSLDDERDVTTRVCLKILERSCVSNSKVDQWVLPTTVVAPVSSLASNEDGVVASPDLARITAALEDDVREILMSTERP